MVLSNCEGAASEYQLEIERFAAFLASNWSIFLEICVPIGQKKILNFH